MAKHKYYYDVFDNEADSREEDDGKHHDGFFIRSNWQPHEFDPEDTNHVGMNLEILVSECAEDYYASHDGWDRWAPGEGLVFVLYLEDKYLGRCTVQLEMSPEFSGSVIQPKTTTQE